MNGAQSLVRTLLAAGVDTCYANPGTSEMHFVAALDTTPGMRCVLGLQENVVTGMADGHFRMAGRPACTLLHCGPGLANGWANLHNARRAGSGIVNLVGDQATWHRPHDAPLTADTEGLARTLAGLLPEQAIVCDESVSFGRGFYPLTVAAAPHDWLHLVGGAIGSGMPMATGAALATGGQRRVINLQADGSAMYTVQALWTQARERLPVTTILLNNRSYNILLGEYRNVGATPGPTAMGMLDLGRPDIDWVRLAGSLGVEAAHADTLEACADLLAHSLRQPGPFLIDLQI